MQASITQDHGKLTGAGIRFTQRTTPVITAVFSSIVNKVYWQALNYLLVGQIYLLDNPLLREPLKREHIKPRLPQLGARAVYFKQAIHDKLIVLRARQVFSQRACYPSLGQLS
jgi:hypothetical protein